MKVSRVISKILPALLLFSAQTTGQVRLLNVPPTDGLSATCVSVLNQQIACNPVLKSLNNATEGGPPFGVPVFLPSTDLTSLCTAACTNALTGWHRRIATACPTALRDDGVGGNYTLTSFSEVYLELYNSTCLTNRAGNRCNTVLADLMNIDLDLQEPTAVPASTFYCHDCFLSLVSTQLAMPMASNTELRSAFSSATSECSSTGWSLVNPPTGTTYTVTPTGPPPRPSCTGTVHEVTSSDTCVGISMSEGISTDDLMVRNGLSAFCSHFPGAGRDLCIPDDKVCEPYTVKESDTCGSLQRDFSIRYAQLIAWNPTLGPKCAHLNRHVGYVICVSNPGGDWVDTNPPPPITSSTKTPLWTRTLAAIDSFPSASYVPSTEDAPYANLTRMDCDVYVTAPVLTNYTANDTTSVACEDVTDMYGIELSQFLDWNPSLNTSNPCTMANNTQYCAQLYPSRGEDVTDACTQMERMPPGHDCNSYTALKGLDTDQFLLWNPGLGANCTDLQIGTQYCVSVRGFRQAGITSNCNQFAMANNTNWDDIPCQIIETKFGVSHARFVAWNPAVRNDCTGLYRGYEYCVSIPNYRPTYTTTQPRPTSWSTEPWTYGTWPITESDTEERDIGLQRVTEEATGSASAATTTGDSERSGSSRTSESTPEATPDSTE